jgi:hypothetical protein
MEEQKGMARHRQQTFGRSGFDLTASSRVCDRCNLTFVEGYTWPGLGIPLVLCRDCTDDIEASVESYGEPAERRKIRLLDRLRGIGA